MLDFRAVGHKVIVKPQSLQRKTKGGLVLPYSDEKLAKASIQRGTVVSIGNNAYKAFRVIDDNGREVNGVPWCRIGDEVLYSRYVGQHYEPEEKEDEDDRYIILNDDDIHAVKFK